MRSRGSLALAVAVAAGLVGVGSARGVATDACPPPVTAADTTVSTSVTYPAGSVLVGSRIAKLSAAIDAGGSQTSYLIEYGSSPAYGLCTPPEPLPAAAGGPQPAPVTLTGLAPATTYHFRVIAETAAGSTAGGDQVFTTLPAGRIPQGTTIDGIRVGGKRRVDAVAAVRRVLRPPARLVLGKHRWTVARRKLGARIDVKPVVAAAVKGMPGASLTAPISVDTLQLTNYLTSVNRRYRQAPRAGTVRLQGDHAVIVQPQTGLEIAPDHARWALTSYLKQGRNAPLRLPTRVAAAPRTDTKAVVIRLRSQSLTAYRNGKVVLQTPVTTGRPALPTPVGSFSIQARYSPYTFISPWPKGNPYYYPPTPVTWAMYFYDNDFLHDDPGEPASAFGQGSENGPYASHGCVHVPHDAMAFLYNWLPIGATVIVSQT